MIHIAGIERKDGCECIRNRTLDYLECNSRTHPKSGPERLDINRRKGLIKKRQNPDATITVEIYNVAKFRPITSSEKEVISLIYRSTPSSSHENSTWQHGGLNLLPVVLNCTVREGSRRQGREFNPPPPIPPQRQLAPCQFTVYD